MILPCLMREQTSLGLALTWCGRKVDFLSLRPPPTKRQYVPHSGGYWQYLPDIRDDSWCLDCMAVREVCLRLGVQAR